MPYDVYEYPLTHGYRNTPEDDNWVLKMNRMPRYLLQNQFEDNLLAYLERKNDWFNPHNFYPLWGMDINSKVVVWDAIYSQVPKGLFSSGEIYYYDGDTVRSCTVHKYGIQVLRISKM